jgi:hypothetical protein
MASDGLAPWGQASAIILAVYLFFSILVSLALVAGLMFALAWIREKAELLRRLRQPMSEINQAAVAAKQGNALPPQLADNKIAAAIVQVPRVAKNVAARASTVEQRVDQGSERVASAVIEFHARTAMVKGMVKAFFLPGLTRTRPAAPVAQPLTQEEQREEEPQVVTRTHEEQPPMEQEIVITQSIR